MTLKVGDIVVVEGMTSSFEVTGFHHSRNSERVLISNKISSTNKKEKDLIKSLTPDDLSIGDMVKVVRKIETSPNWRGVWVYPMDIYIDHTSYPSGFRITGKDTGGVRLNGGNLTFPYECLERAKELVEVPPEIRNGDIVRVKPVVNDTSKTVQDLSASGQHLKVAHINAGFAYFNAIMGWIEISKLEKVPPEPALVLTEGGLGVKLPPASELGAVFSIKVTEKEKDMSAVLAKLAGITDDEIFNNIQQLENEKIHLEGIKNKPKALVSKIAAIQADIDKLVKFSDDRSEKVNL